MGNALKKDKKTAERTAAYATGGLNTFYRR